MDTPGTDYDAAVQVLVRVVKAVSSTNKSRLVEIFLFHQTESRFMFILGLIAVLVGRAWY